MTRTRSGRFSALSRTVAGILTVALLSSAAGGTAAAAAATGRPVPELSVWVDGRPLALDPAPVIVQGRTLVPMRAIFTALGAQVQWDAASRTVTATAPGRYVRLRIDDPTACLSPACTPSHQLDVPPRIIANRTFVPARFVATALGATVTWDGSQRAVIIRSALPPAGGDSPGGEEGGTASPPAADPATRAVSILSVAPGQPITGTITLRSRVQVPAARIRYFLLDPATGRGPILAVGADPGGSYSWRPDPAYNGSRTLVAAVYDAQDRLLARESLPVQVAVTPRVTVQGISPGQVFQGTGGSVTLRAEVNFVATTLSWALVDPNSGRAYPISEADPYGSFTWWPGVWSNGSWLLRATAYDRAGQAHHSPGIPIVVQMEPWTGVSGVKAGQTISGPVNLRAQVNYSASRVEFRLADGTLLGESSNPGESFRWFPHPDQSGPQTIYLTVWDANGVPRRAEPVPVTVQVQPTLRLQGVGPGQVITGEDPAQLRVESNVPLTSVSFLMARPGSDNWVTVAGGADATATYTWTPAPGQEGEWRIRAQANGPRGLLATESVTVRAYTGTVYSHQAAVESPEAFIEMITPWAIRTYKQTGMSAALQVAQAALETGYGRYVPRDKYSGQFSYNLFGIKGEGPAGSVIITTTEYYNGVRYTVDDYFRAYHSLEESWDDHKRFLLDPSRERYAPFRAVMHDPVQGAWALRRTGYATDPRYAQKLVDIMERWDLFKLDLLTP